MPRAAVRACASGRLVALGHTVRIVRRSVVAGSLWTCGRALRVSFEESSNVSDVERPVEQGRPLNKRTVHRGRNAMASPNGREMASKGRVSMKGQEGFGTRGADQLRGVDEDEEMVPTPFQQRNHSISGASFVGRPVSTKGAATPGSSNLLRRSFEPMSDSSPRRASEGLAGNVRRRGSLQVEDLPAFSRNRSRPETDSSDAEMANSLSLTRKHIEEKIGSALDKIDELHDSIADKLPEDMEEDLRALELGVHEAFDAMARNVQEAVKTMSEKDSEVHREHSKAAQKQFDKKLEQSRAAGKVALQNKSTELAANFKKEMQQQLADLKDGGGALLLEAQQAAEEAREELAQERLKHETSKETLRVSQEKVQQLESQLRELSSRDDHDDDEDEKIMLQMQKAALEKEMEEGRLELTKAVDDLQQRISEMMKEKTTMSKELEQVFADLGLSETKNMTLSEQIAQLIKIQETLQGEVQASAVRLEEERNRTQEALRVSAAEAERAAIAHAEECRRLTNKLAEKMQTTVEAIDSGGELDNHDEQMRHLLAELKELQQSKAVADDTTVTLQKDIKTLATDLRETKTQYVEAQTQLAQVTREVEVQTEKVAELSVVVKHQDDELTRLRPLEKSKGSIIQMTKEIEALKKELGKAGINITHLEKERKDAQEAASKALQDLGFTRQKNKSLAEEIRDLIKTAETSRKERNKIATRLEETEVRIRSTEEKAKAKQKELESQIADANTRIAEGEKWRREAMDLKAEIERIRTSLHEVISSVQVFKNDKRQLSEQIREVVTRYRTAEQALERTSKELIVVTGALQHSTAELTRRTDAARREREQLVRAALSSMQQLRSHLTFTLAGLRVNQSKGEQAAMPWKRSAGVIMPDGDPMLIQFIPPLHKSLGGSKQLDHVYANEETVGLPPVQVQPPTPIAPPPGDVWHSDIPADPMLPSYRLGKPTEGHRWGVVARPPTHANPGRAASARRSPRQPPASARATAQAAKWTEGENVRPRPRTALNLKKAQGEEPLDTDAILKRWESNDDDNEGEVGVMPETTV